MTAFDAIAVVERAYDLEADDQAWLREVAVAAAPGLERGFGILALLFGPKGVTEPLAGLVVGDPRVATLSQKLAPRSSDAVSRAFTTTTGVTSIRAILRGIGDDALASFDRAASSLGIRDALGMIAHDGEERAVNIASYSPREESPRALDSRSWFRIAAHVGAALRLRHRRHEIPTAVEAILSRDGRLQHAEGELRDDGRRTSALSASTLQMVRARGARRSDPQVLAQWLSMVCGRWTLVDRVDTDGKHLVEAHVNTLRRPELADLTPLERSCVELARRGHSNKQIAYALGLSLGTISATLTVAMRKCGVRSRVGLIALGDGPSLEKARRALGPDATPAEIAVSVMCASGMSNAEIATERGVSARTVANQLARLFERLGVASRAELAVLVRTAAYR